MIVTQIEDENGTRFSVGYQAGRVIFGVAALPDGEIPGSKIRASLNVDEAEDLARLINKAAKTAYRDALQKAFDSHLYEEETN